MKRIDINTQQSHFIGCWNLENNKLCNEITNFFKNNKNLQKQGVTASGKDLKKKSRIDITVSPNDLKNPKFEILKQYINELHKCFLDYQNQWPFLKSMLKDGEMSTIIAGIAPFFAADVLRLILLIMFPALALWLPSLLS